ncbi:alcohol dehydrogenase [Paramyrothecium foliicola]|nr:alcohol dehydrogenase [Paramyrothecium foliicola]
MGRLDGGYGKDLSITHAVGLSIASFLVVAFYNVIKLNVIIFTTFKKFKTLYPWSLLVATWGIAVWSLGFLLKTYRLSNGTLLYSTYVASGWCAMVTGQSLILYSRLHIIVYNRRVPMLLLSVIIFNAVFSTSPRLSWATERTRILRTVAEAELIISITYVTRLLRRLVVINCLVIALDINVLALEYAGLYDIQTAYKGMAYSIKLKLEFRILNDLVEFTPTSLEILSINCTTGNGTDGEPTIPPHVAFAQFSGAGGARKMDVENGAGCEPLVKQVDVAVSSQLYEKSTRFLLEMLQNADDNSYSPEAVPTIHITYEPGYLRVDCNEQGFNQQNIEAICKVGGSTKKTIDHSTRYIGEKGIGFKSTFKVANVVWISSGNYNFKFDVSGHLGKLGMIAPQWEAFPRKRLPGYTSFLLQLSDPFYEKEIVDEIFRFDPAFLMFLRQVRTIKLKISRLDGSSWSDELSRRDVTQGNERTTTLRRKDWEVQYLVKRHIVNDLPEVHQRPGCSASEIVLAFPMPISLRSASLNPKVYAFLPIRDYGFKFTLQADFLLTASRESIDEDSPWNHALRDAAVDAFLLALDNLGSSQLRYHWPRYIPASNVAGFFSKTRSGILRGLQSKKVLESYCSNLSFPSSLLYVPPSFLDSNGVPFGLQSQSAGRYLSAKYADQATNLVRELGISHLSPKEFIQDLCDSVKDKEADFQSKPLAWHSQLAQSLLPLISNSETREAVRKINIIPLASGKWVSVEGNAIVFSGSFTEQHILDGLGIPKVRKDAENDPQMRKLYHQLGVTGCESAAICEKIAAAHSSSGFNPAKLSRKTLVDQVLFLYKSSWRIPNDTKFWFATQDDGRCIASELYVSGTHSSDALGRVMRRLQDWVRKTPGEQKPFKKFQFIHPDYSIALAHVDKNWQDWLTGSFRISTIPRLTSSSSKGKSDTENGTDLKLSNDFLFLFQHHNTSDVLRVMRDNWHHYSRCIEQEFPSVKSDVSQSISLEMLRSIKVDCGGNRVKISQTVLPGLDPTMDSDIEIPILHVEDHEDSRWSILESFGVSVKRDVGYYVKCLESLQQSPFVDMDTLLHIYQQIQVLIGGNEDLILLHFRDKDLIYLPSVQKTKFSFPWYPARECVGQIDRVENLYPSCKILFRSLLIAGEGSLGPAVTKATLINEETKIDEIVEIFQQLNDAVKVVSSKRAKQALKRLTNSRIFPVLFKKKQKTGYEFLDTLTKSSTWFLGDREHLADSFQGLVPLLAFTSEQINSMQAMFKHLEHLRWLSEIVETSAHPAGLITLRPDYTNFLRSRSVFIESLQLQGVKAFVTAGVTQTHKLKYKETDVSGYGSGEVALQSPRQELELYLTEECINTDSAPFELVEQLAAYCGIQSTALLYATLANRNVARVKAAFLKEGLHINTDAQNHVHLLQPEKQVTRYAGSSGELFMVYSPFTPLDAASGDDHDPSTMDGITFVTVNELGTTDRRRVRRRVQSSRSNVALPFRTIIRTGEFEYGQDSVYDQKLENMVDNQRSKAVGDLQFTGEYLVSQKALNYSHFADGPSHGPMYTSEKLLALYIRLVNIGRVDFVLERATKQVRITLTIPQLAPLTGGLQGYRDAAPWLSDPPAYYFDVAVSVGGGGASFTVDASMIEKMRVYQFSELSRTAPRRVMILVRLTNVYTTVNLELFVNPWQLFLKGQLSLRSGPNLRASLQGQLNPLRIKNPVQFVETIDRAFSLSTEYDHIEPTWEFFLELAKYPEWEARNTRFAMLNLLESFRYAESTRARDRFFALTTLASDWNAAAFAVDYNADFETIVRRFAWEFVKQGKLMLLLYRAGHGAQPGRFPSWIPDWTVPKPRSLYQSSVLGVECAASWTSKPKHNYEPDSDEISIYGCMVDTEVISLVDSVKNNPVPDSFADIKWKVPIAGALYPRKAGGEANIKRSYEALVRELVPSKASPVSGRASKAPAALPYTQDEGGDTYRRALCDNLRGWKVFLTQEGYVGVAPDGLREGDLICIFDGGAVPFAIRKCDHRTGSHRLIICVCPTQGLSLRHHTTNMATLPSAMRAAVVKRSEEGFKFEVAKLEVPVPGPLEVLVRLTVTGICGTDIALASGVLGPTKDILGHEGVGYAVKIGESVPKDQVSIGDRIGIAWLRDICGVCPYCLHPGGETRCVEQLNSGRKIDGTFAEYALVPSRYLVVIPKRFNIPDEHIAPILCGGVTAYAALKKSGGVAGQWVVISGAGGGVGGFAIQYAKAMGYRTIAIDLGDSKRNFCLSLGADHFIDSLTIPNPKDLVDTVTQGGGASIILACSGSGEAYTKAIGLLGPFGKLVCVGIPPPDQLASFHPLLFIDKGTTIMGAAVGTKQDILEAVEFVQRGLVTPRILRKRLDDLPDTVTQFHQLSGKVVIHFDNAESLNEV